MFGCAIDCFNEDPCLGDLVARQEFVTEYLTMIFVQLMRKLLSDSDMIEYFFELNYFLHFEL